jgi:hypothetical protein
VSYFANALYGIVVPDEPQEKLQELWEDHRDLKEERNDDLSDMANFYMQKRVKALVTKLGFPFSAGLIRLPDEDCAVEEGSFLAPGTFVLGWGILTFPSICNSEEFIDYTTKNPGKCDWHMWVSIG